MANLYRCAHRIVLAKDLAPDQEAKTLAHEIAHHMLEHGRGQEPGRPTKEAEAEGVAFVVCSRFGLDTSEYSFGYVATWARDKGGPALVKQASTAIQGVAREMIERMEPQKAQAQTRTTQAKEIMAAGAVEICGHGGCLDTPAVPHPRQKARSEFWRPLRHREGWRCVLRSMRESRP